QLSAIAKIAPISSTNQCHDQHLSKPNTCEGCPLTRDWRLLTTGSLGISLAGLLNTSADKHSCRTQRYFLNVAAVMAMATPSITAQGTKTTMGLSEKGRDR